MKMITQNTGGMVALVFSVNYLWLSVFYCETGQLQDDERVWAQLRSNKKRIFTAKSDPILIVGQDYSVIMAV